MDNIIFVHLLTANNCFYNGQAKNYMGTKAVTDNLYTCQRWETQEPHRHSYTVTDFPDPTMPDNYCRTTQDSARPWCYTTNKDQRWEHCNINNCSTYIKLSRARASLSILELL